ncbi:hypothetical protein D3C87_1870990 [compost metagenome]
MDERDDDGIGVVEQRRQRLVDDTDREQAGVHDAAIAEDRFPGHHPQEIAGPAGHCDEEQPEVLVNSAMEGDEPGDRIGNGDGHQAHDQRNDQ